MTENVRDPEGTRTVFDPEGARARQMEQATGQATPLRPGGDLEPNDQRVVTGAASAGVGAPGGSDQQTGGARYGAPQQQVDAAGQPGEAVEFEPDPQLEQSGEVEFEPGADLGQQQDRDGGSNGGG